jgi:hypothetical protein
MEPAAGLRRNVGGVERGGWVGWLENQMLAVAIGTVRDIPDAGFESCAMNTFVELSGDLFVALGAGSYDIPVADFRLSFPRRRDSVATVAVGAGRGILALCDGAAMHALQILLDGMQHGNLVARQKPWIRVTLSACSRQISPGDG